MTCDDVLQRRGDELRQCSGNDTDTQFTVNRQSVSELLRLALPQEVVRQEEQERIANALHNIRAQASVEGLESTLTVVDLKSSIEQVLILGVAVSGSRRSFSGSRQLFLDLHASNDQVQRIQQQLRHSRSGRSSNSMTQSGEDGPAADGRRASVSLFLDPMVEGKSVLTAVLSGMKGKNRAEITYELSIVDGVCGFEVCHVCAVLYIVFSCCFLRCRRLQCCQLVVDGYRKRQCSGTAAETHDLISLAREEAWVEFSWTLIRAALRYACAVCGVHVYVL